VFITFNSARRVLYPPLRDFGAFFRRHDG